jgi:hypothetical protein
MSTEFFSIIADGEAIQHKVGYNSNVVARLTNGEVEGALIINTKDLQYRNTANECIKCGRTDVTQQHARLCSGVIKTDKGMPRKYDGEGTIVQPVPDVEGREVGYIVGQSGAGKTVFLVNYLVEYLTMFESNSAFIFTGATADDPAYSVVRTNPHMNLRVTFASIGKDILEQSLEPESFENSLVIFDDTGAIEDKDVKKKIDNLRSRLCLVGRHKKVSVITTNHLESEFTDKSLKTAITESHFLVIFPRHGTELGLNRLLTTWYGLPNRTKEDKEVVAKIKSVASRWVYLKKGYPKYVLYETGAFIL